MRRKKKDERQREAGSGCNIKEEYIAGKEREFKIIPKNRNI